MVATALLDVSRNTDAVKVTHRPLPDDVELPPRPKRADGAGPYQRVLLDVRTGALSFFCADWRVHVPIPQAGDDRTLWDAQHPGSGPNIMVYNATKPVPTLLSFTIDTWATEDYPADDAPTPAWVYMTRAQGEAFVASLAPLAQQLVDSLFRVAGTDDLEWSTESAAAVRAIYAACDRYHQGPRGVEVVKAATVNFGDAVAAVPELAQGAWAEMDDAGLDRAADAWTRGATNAYPQLKETFGEPYRDGGGIGLDVYGARSWLYAYRAHEADHRPVLGAAAWFAQKEHTLTGRVTANHDDDALTAFAKRERTAAANAGIKLVAIDRVVRAYRDELRARIVADELPRAAKAVEKLKDAKATRAGLLAQIIGWGDPRYHSDKDAELGRLAGVTRQWVNQLRATVTDGD